MSDRGVTVARAALQLREKEGYVPDVIFGHSGWGETLFLKEVWPEAKLLVYAEFYYRGRGADVGFDPEFNPPSFDQVMIAQGRTAHLGQALLHADRGPVADRMAGLDLSAGAAADDRRDLRRREHRPSWPRTPPPR
jgi:hypothetical protein